MKSISLVVFGAFLGVLGVVLYAPKLVMEVRFKAKMEAFEYILVDHEKEINQLKKRLDARHEMK